MAYFNDNEELTTFQSIFSYRNVNKINYSHTKAFIFSITTANTTIKHARTHTHTSLYAQCHNTMWMIQPTDSGTSSRIARILFIYKNQTNSSEITTVKACLSNKLTSLLQLTTEQYYFFHYRNHSAKQTKCKYSIYILCLTRCFGGIIAQKSFTTLMHKPVE